MFTGLVETVGVVTTLRKRGDGLWALSVEAPSIAAAIRPGQSLCVSGACLTVTSVAGGGCTVDVMAETMRRTKFGGLRPGAGVNLERALAVDARLDGHIVTGHVDCTTRIRRCSRGRDGYVLSFPLPEDLLLMTVPQGSIAVDGVSLTVSSLTEEACSVSLIPATLESTTLGGLRAGDEVNIETDILGKYVRRLLGRGISSLSIRRLEDAGWTDHAQGGWL